ncbi:unnamed protein product [Closterium sp. NIES-53]
MGNAAFVARFNVASEIHANITMWLAFQASLPNITLPETSLSIQLVLFVPPQEGPQSDASQEQLGVDDGYAAEMVGEANASDILEDYVRHA